MPLSFALADDMETMDHWDAAGSWGVSTTNPLSGNGSFNESPGGDDPNSYDSYVMTSIRLVGTTNPVLRFWDRYRMGSGDWGRVEISTDGSGWSSRY